VGSIKVKVLFTGLCAFVPQKSIYNKYGDNEQLIQVIMPDATMTYDHRPVLLVPAYNCIFSAQPSFPLTTAPDYYATGKPVNAFFLKEVDLAFFGQNVPVQFEKVDTVLSTQLCPTQSDTSFDWISKMGTVGAGEIDSRVLESYPPASVLARFRLTGGTLATYSFLSYSGTNERDKVGKWQFLRGSRVAGQARAIAEVSALEFYVEPNGNDWGLEFKFWGSGKKSLLLKEEDVTLWVVNVPLPNLLGYGIGAVESPQLHFEHFYELAMTSTGYLPWLVGDCGAGGLTGPKCPTVLFDPNAKVK